MKAVTVLERLGYFFTLKGNQLSYTHSGKKPDPDKVRPLLDFLRQRAPFRPLHSSA